ncbi:MAG: hypothetical protein ACTHMG_16790 [Sphingomonas sp.]
MDVRGILTSAAIGAIVALVVREFMQCGLAIRQWSLGVPRGGEALIIGGLVGAIIQLIGRTGGRR